MSEKYDKEKKVALFKNDKGDNAKRPDYRGTMTLNGVEYKLSLWLRKSQKGEHYMQGSVEEAKPRTPSPGWGAPLPPPTFNEPPTPPPAQQQAANATGADEDVPF